MIRTLALSLAIVCTLGTLACRRADEPSDTTAPRAENSWDAMSWDSGEWA